MSTYASRLKAKLDPKHPCNQSFPAVRIPLGADVDEEKLLGGYQRYVGKGKARRKNRCYKCFQYRSANGTCSC